MFHKSNYFGYIYDIKWINHFQPCTSVQYITNIQTRKMKRIFTILLLAFSMFATAQMTVTPSSTVYVDNTVLFVEDDLDLVAADSRVLLRNEAQFVQGLSNGTNTGLGELSVYQFGVTGIYEYNSAWCSPVGRQIGTGNQNFNITMFNDVVDNVTSNPVAITTAYNGSAAPMTISNFWIFSMELGTVYQNWVFKGSLTSWDILPGQSHTMKGTGIGLTYDYRGRPNNADITIPVGPGAMSSVGNPYASAIDLKYWLIDNSAVIDGAAYFWEMDTVGTHVLVGYEGGYGTYTPGDPMDPADNGSYTIPTFFMYSGDGNSTVATVGMGTFVERRMSPVGQGWIVRGTAAGATTTSNIHRVYYPQSGPLSNFTRSSIPQPTNIQSLNGIDYNTVLANPTVIPEIRLNISRNDERVIQTLIAFRQNASDGYEYWGDAPAPDETIEETYFDIGGRKCVITSLQWDITKRIPLTFEYDNQATFTVNLSSIADFDVNQDIFIYDSLNDSYTNLKNTDFEITLDGGLHNDRFEVVFQQNTLSIDDIEPDMNTIEIYGNGTQIHIENPRNIKLNYTVYSIDGKKIVSGTSAATEDIQLNVSTGIYVVDAKTSNGLSITEKVMLK